jgi:hypothetical protein
MWSPRMGSLFRSTTGRRLAVWAALAMGWLLPSTGCQVEYAGMTLPSGKYFHDDVQYFPPGPDFPWANTQAATQRARMQAMGIETPAPDNSPFVPPRPPGSLDPTQNQPVNPPNINANPLPPMPGDPNVPQGVPVPGAPVPRPPNAVPGPGQGDPTPPPGNPA